jgi:hypothetical protein
MPYNNISFLKEAMKEDRCAGIWDGYNRLGTAILLLDERKPEKPKYSQPLILECWHSAGRGLRRRKK